MTSQRPLHAALALGCLLLAGCIDGDREQELVDSDATILVSESLDPDLDYYLKAPLFDCQYYAVNQLSSATSCDAAKVHWLRHGLRQGFQGSAEFSIRTYLAQASPLLVKFFGDNYRQAWHYYRHFGSVRPFKASAYTDPANVERRVFDIDDFAPPDTVDWAPAFAAALGAARQFTASSGGIAAEVRFGPRTYRVSCFGGTNPLFARNTGYCFQLAGLRNVLVAGTEGRTKILIDNPEIGFVRFTEGENLFFQGLTVDWVTAPFIQGAIVGLLKQPDNSFKVTVAVDDSFLHVGIAEIRRGIEGDGDGDRRGLFILMDAAAPHRKIGTHNFIRASSVIEGSGGQLVFTFTPPNDQLVSFRTEAAVGDRFVYTLRHGGAVFNLTRNNNVGLNKVTIHAAPSVAIICSENTGHVNFNELVIRSESSKKKLISSSAGGVNCPLNRGPVLLQNSYFDGLTDDAMATTGGTAFVTAVISSTQIELSSNRAIAAEDRLEFLDPRTAKLLGVSRVVTLVDETPSQPGFRRYTATLDKSIEGMDAGDGTAPERGTDFVTTVAYNVSNAAPNSVFRDNIFGYNRGAALRPLGPRSTITRNDVLLVGSIGFQAQSSVRSFIIGPIPNNLHVTNNALYGGVDGRPQMVIGKDSQTSTIIANRTSLVDVSDNRLIRPVVEPIKIQGLVGVTLSNNVISP